MLETIGPELAIGLEDDFGIAVRDERLPSFTQLVPQLAEVVNHPVVNDDCVAFSVEHRLMACGREVDDRQPRAPKREPLTLGSYKRKTLVIRAARDHSPTHCCYGASRLFSIRCECT